MKLFLEAGNPPDSDDLDMSYWLEKDEERCRRVNELRAKLAEEKQRVLAWMENMKQEEEAIPKGWKAKTDLDSEDMPDSHELHGKHVWKRVERDPRVGNEEMDEDKPIPEGWKTPPTKERTTDDNNPTGRITGGLSHHPCEGAPPQQINTRESGLKSQEQDPENVPEGWKQSEDESIDNQYIRNSSKAELWVVNFDSSNRSFKVPGNRDRDRDLGWQDENPSMNKTQKSVATHFDVGNVIGIESEEIEIVENYGGTGGAINTRACDLKSQDDRIITEGLKIKREERGRKKIYA
jgi:hypothetical protein